MVSSTYKVTSNIEEYTRCNSFMKRLDCHVMSLPRAVRCNSTVTTLSKSAGQVHAFVFSICRLVPRRQSKAHIQGLNVLSSLLI